jgi:hypothetical protein
MTAANHMMAGAVVATAIHNPLLVFPAVIASHFVLDIMPHFGVHEGTPSERNKHPLFRYILAIDIFLTAVLLVMLPSILRGAVSWWVLVIGMFLAWAPDLVWVREFFKVVRTKRDHKRKHWVTRLHQKIQWFEKPWGIVTEVVWFGGMAVLLGVLAT